MTLHEIVTHPVFIGWWSAFGVDFWHWLSSPDWRVAGFDFKIASKRWLIGLVMGLIAWQGLGTLIPAALSWFAR